jgi:two-component system sensor histidine kinase YesM
MIKKTAQWLGDLKKSGTLLMNCLKLLLVMFALIMIVTLFIYGNSRQILQQELLRGNASMTRNVANSIDEYLSNMRYVTATLAVNQMVRFYFTAPDPASIFSGFHERIQEHLASYVHGFSYIHSIYLYAPGKQRYIDSTGEHSISFLNDRGWMPLAEGMAGNVRVVPRKVGDLYPYALTIINRVNGGEGVVVLNLNLRRLPNALDIGADGDSRLYIVTNQREVLYRKNQDGLLEDAALFPELAPFRPGAAQHSILVENAEKPYAYTQIASRDYDWSYVTVAYLQEYTARVSDQRALLIVFFAVMLLFSIGVAVLFSMSFYRPIRQILEFLSDPEDWSASRTGDENDIREIVGKIVSYVQANGRLSQELKTKLNLLNETRVWALQSQINPHFLQNTLNLIHLSITESFGAKHVASEMAVHLGKILHYALEPTSLVTIESELAYTRHFFAILNERFDKQIEAAVSVSPGALPAKIPKLILQPLIENSVLHGMGPRGSAPLVITISGSLDTALNRVALTIGDNGQGIPAEELGPIRKTLAQEYDLQAESHIGLRNVATRLRLLFGEASEIKIESVRGEGTSITVAFPFTA